MKALYRLSRLIAGFDFFHWLVQQDGATEVVFDIRSPNTKRWQLETVVKRFESILWPGPALWGLEATIGTQGQTFGGYTARELIQSWHAGKRFKRLKSVLPHGTEKYTVTLRTDKRIPGRNSNEQVWRQFAQDIGARVIPDYEVEPIHLHERMALYCGAEMNFFVTNGPIALCLLSEAPAMGFDLNISPVDGVPYGNVYPWNLPDRHFQIFETATLPVIHKHFDAWRKNRWV